MNNLTNFIRIVLSQSKLAMEKGEIPIASVIVDQSMRELLLDLSIKKLLQMIQQHMQRFYV